MQIPNNYMAQIKALTVGGGKVIIPFEAISEDQRPEKETIVGGQRSQWLFKPTPEGFEVTRVK